jgi:hypothetical protein
LSNGGAQKLRTTGAENMDKELIDLVSEFRLDRYRQIYMRIFLERYVDLAAWAGPARAVLV